VGSLVSQVMNLESGPAANLTANPTHTLSWAASTGESWVLSWKQTKFTACFEMRFVCGGGMLLIESTYVQCIL